MLPAAAPTPAFVIRGTAVPAQPTLVAVRGMTEEQSRSACNSTADKALSIVGSIARRFAYWDGGGLDVETMSKKLGKEIPDKLATADILISTVLSQCKGSIDDETCDRVIAARGRLSGLEGRLNRFSLDIDWAAVARGLSDFAAVLERAIAGWAWSQLQGVLGQRI